LGFLIDIVAHGGRHIHTSTITLATHAAIYALLVFVLYGTLRYSNIQHNRRVATDGLLTNQDNLDSARNDVIRTAYQNLSEPVAAISLTAKVLVNDSPASNSILAALDEFRSILDKLKTVIELKNVPLEATQSINLLSVLQPATTALFQAIDAKHLSVNYAPGIANQSVLADPVLLDKIVTSILDNAVKFSPERGSIDIGYVVAHDSMSLTIKDQGQGIDPGYMARLFQPFSRAEANALTFNYEGIGLSLYTAKLLARCLHGDIDLSSLSGQGTTVAIKLPKPKKSVLANTNQSPINAQPASAMAHSVAL
jgi:two-component system phosphate regulon sensor histidine kinase PhoR